jgi:hypothetical protein
MRWQHNFYSLRTRDHAVVVIPSRSLHHLHEILDVGSISLHKTWLNITQLVVNILEWHVWLMMHCFCRDHFKISLLN